MSNQTPKACLPTSRCVLLTGFTPFGGERINPSWEAVRQLDGARIDGHHVIARQLPTAFGTSLQTLHEALHSCDPALVIAVGLAGGRAQVSLERVAINLVDARIADNQGAQPIDTRVIDDGPDAFFATLPLKSMLQALRRDGIPASISYSAGTYVCNYAFYALMHALRASPTVIGGFVHVPYLPQQAAGHPDAPSMSLQTMVRALEIMVRNALRPEPVAAGTSAGREA